jgi:hypothetical protein
VGVKEIPKGSQRHDPKMKKIDYNTEMEFLQQANIMVS